MRASRPHEKRKSPPLKSSKMSKAGGAAGRSRAGRLFSERRRVDAGGASRFFADPAGVRADVAADEEAEATAAELTPLTNHECARARRTASTC